MGTCFSYLKRNMKTRSRHQNYCLTPRSFYQHDTDVVELQYLVSSENTSGEPMDSASIPIADVNEKEDEMPICPASEGDMMLRMIMSNSINRMPPHRNGSNDSRNEAQTTNEIGGENCVVDNCNNISNKIWNAESVNNNSCNVTYHRGSCNSNRSTTHCGQSCGAKHSQHCYTKSASRCSSRITSNSGSNSSSIDLEWESDGNAAEGAVGINNKPIKVSVCQQHSSEDSVEQSLISSAESLEWDGCESGVVMLDSDTEHLIQEIERLTARALKETGSDYNFNHAVENAATTSNLEMNGSYTYR